MDRFLAVTFAVAADQLQLLGSAALLVAAKKVLDFISFNILFPDNLTLSMRIFFSEGGNQSVRGQRFGGSQWPHLLSPVD